MTSWSELAREGRAALQAQLRSEAADTPHVTTLLAGDGPVIAASDYVCAVPESVRAHVPSHRRYVTLGTDGFGRSDTRSALRDFFGVDAASIVRAVKASL